jgi:hypothetical protein
MAAAGIYRQDKCCEAGDWYWGLYLLLGLGLLDEVLAEPVPKIQRFHGNRAGRVGRALEDSRHQRHQVG